MHSEAWRATFPTVGYLAVAGNGLLLDMSML